MLIKYMFFRRTVLEFIYTMYDINFPNWSYYWGNVSGKYPNDTRIGVDTIQLQLSWSKDPMFYEH